jgi:predicted transcriptional regulator
MQIKELSIDERDKDALREMISPKRTAQIAVIIDKDYNTANKRLQVWEARGWIKKFKKGITTFYYLNGDLLQVED